MKPIKIILHPTDFSENSTSALELACSLARDQRARLILLHVVPPAPDVFWLEDFAARPRAEHLEEDLRAYRNEMEQKLHQLRVPDPGCPVERHLREGNVPAAILHMAEETMCDLIVMGTHGQTGPGRGLMGSVAEAVTRGAPCPVLTLSTPRPNGQTAENSVAEATGRAVSVP
jgi:nucleotide-binding universal stress UspA family protein